MKRLIGLLILTYSLMSYPVLALAQEKQLEGTITLSGAWAIYPTAVAWAQAFQKQHTKVKIDVSAGGAGKGAADAIAGLVDVGMVSRDPDKAEVQKGVVPVYVLHDAVFPVVSDKNSALKDLMHKGVARETWVGLYITGKITTWDEVAGGQSDKPVHVYTRSDSCGAAASWANYIDNKKQEDLRGVGVYGDPGLLDAAIKDPIGVGYSNFSYVFTREGTVVKGAKLVPIDSNGNGIADDDERYDTREAAIKAIESGRYPATRKNYFFVKGNPRGLVKAFIEFALSEEGTRIVNEVGTSLPLQKQDRESVLKSLE
jgi:phosphate transport system substrate-binding protein